MAKSKLSYFIILILFIYICTFVQSFFFAQMSSQWFHIDLVSIIIFFLSLEHHAIFAAVFAIFAGILLQINVLSPPVFFIIYFMFVVLFSNIITSFFVINSLFSKTIIFGFLYLIKYILFYFSLNNHFEIGVSKVTAVYWKEYLATAVSAFFVYKLLFALESFFMLPNAIKKR